MKTLHDRYCESLLAVGAEKLPKKNKYTMFQLDTRYYFVGSNGALRFSSRPNAARSIPCSNQFKKKLMDRQ